MLMAKSCCVSIVVLRKIFCTVRGWTLMRSASHSLVWPCRRSSSRMSFPISICITKNRESFLSALEVLDYLYSKQRSSRFLCERSASMLEYSKKRNCPDSECYYESKKRLIMSLSYYSIFLYLLCL